MEEVQGVKGGRRIIEVWEPNYRMKPDENEMFWPSEVKDIVERVVHSKLDGKTYSEEDSKRWAIEIADEIRLGTKELRIPRYKVIVQVNIGEVCDQGIRVTSRCLWDATTDNYTTVQYKAKNVWCCAMCFGIFAE